MFKAWTDPKHVAQWWGPHGFTNPVCELDVRPGGTIRIHMRGPDGTLYPMTGVHREIVEPERLVFTSAALDEEGNPLFEVLTTVTMAERGGKTTLAVQARVAKSTAEAAPYLGGWKQAGRRAWNASSRMWRPEEKKNQNDLKPTRRRAIMLKKILVALAAIVIVFLGVVAMQPSEFRVARTATIATPAPVVFAQVNDFHNWEAWNPWAKLDPAMKQTYEGAPAGSGAIYTWAGNSQVGEGRMTLTESRPSDLIRIELEFLKPFAGTSTAEFTFKPEGNQTAVVWSMAGTNNFMAKAVCLFMSMDKMIGGQFEKGLAQMKAVAEATPKQ